MLYAITQAAKYGAPEFMSRLAAALDEDVRLIQVRERGMPPDELTAFAQDVIAAAHGRGARVLINGDVTLATRVGADGVHLQGAQLMQFSARPQLPLVGASCHNTGELARAVALGADFALLSPVLPTATHPDEPGMGWDKFQTLVTGCPLPVYALGGMRRELLDTALRHGAHGVALLSDIWRQASR
jgi:8-oxo-dGTP diphosphatase